MALGCGDEWMISLSLQVWQIVSVRQFAAGAGRVVLSALPPLRVYAWESGGCFRKEKVEGPCDLEQQCLTILPSILSSLLVAERDGPARVVVIVRHHYLASRQHGWQLRCAKAAR